MIYTAANMNIVVRVECISRQMGRKRAEYLTAALRFGVILCLIMLLQSLYPTAHRRLNIITHQLCLRKLCEIFGKSFAEIFFFHLSR